MPNISIELEEQLKNQSKKLLKNMDMISKYVIYSKTNLKGIIIEVSDAFCEISQYSRDELIGQPHNIVRHKDMPKSAFKDLWKTVQNKEVWSGEVKNRAKDGGYYWVDANIAPEFNDDGDVTNYIAIRHDITANKNLEIQYKLFNEILDTTKNIVVITNFKDIKFANSRFKKMFHIDKTDEFNNIHFHKMLERFVEIEGFLHLGLLKENESFVSLVHRTDKGNRIVAILNKNFKIKAFKIDIVKLKQNDDYLLTLSDITKLKKDLIQVKHKAYIDGLTQVNNRNKFDEVLEKEIKRVKRYKEPITIAMIDIDKFKTFNDTFGHLIGDEVLVTMAQTVNNAVRETDTFARWGGEEFVILFLNTKVDIAKQVSETIKDKIEENEHPTAGKITASFGLTQYKDGDTIKTMFKRCDDALYVAKENGRNRVEIL